MRMTDRNQRRLFCIVQFIELPFKDIDDNVCVPISWVLNINRKSPKGKVDVTYPNNENPLETRERVKRRERPNDSWRFYVAYLKHKSEVFVDTGFSVVINEFGADKEETKKKDTEPEPQLNRKLRSASESCWSESKSVKPQFTVEPSNTSTRIKNPRKPLPRILIRRPLPPKPDKKINSKCLKLNENPKPVVITDHITAPSGSSKQKQSIIITGNQVIQKGRTKTNYTSNGDMNTEQSTQPEVIKENQPVDFSVQSTLAKLPVVRQLSPQRPTEQQLSLQSPTGRILSPQLRFDRQPSPKFIAEQHSSSKFSSEQQPSSVGQDYQQPFSVSTVDLDESKDLDSHQNIMPEPVTNERPSTKTPQSTFKPAPQLCSINSNLNSKFQPQGFGGRNSIEVADNKSRQQPSKVNKMKNPVDKKTRLEGITKNIANQQYPPNAMRQLVLPTASTVAQSAQFPQHHLQQAEIDGSLMNDDRRRMRENYINQRDPRPQGIMNTSAAQNLSNLAHQNNPFLGTSHEQQYLPTRGDYLSQFTLLQDMLRRSNITPTHDLTPTYDCHQNVMMNAGCVIQSQPNPINQTIQFLPQYVNQYVPINSAYSQEVKSHELLNTYTDGPHVTYKPIAPKQVNIQIPAYHLSSQFHRDSKHLQNIQYQQNYRDPRTTNTQDDLPFKSTHSSIVPKHQKVTKRLRSLSASKTPSQSLLDAQRSCLIQELGIQERVNQSPTKSNNTNLAAISEIQAIELTSSTENPEIQTMPSSNQIQATQFTLVQNKHDCQYLGMKKTMIDRSTETDSMMDVSHCVEAIAGSSLRESTSRTVDSVCQTDEWLEKEQDSLHEETSSHSENTTDNESESENEVVLEANQAFLPAEQKLTQENQHEHSRIIVEQDMLDTIGTLMTQMGANLSLIRDMFDCLRNSIRVCAQTYESLLQKVDKFNSIQTLQNSASPPNNVISQVTQSRLAGDMDNSTSVGSAMSSIHKQSGSFSLPAEYDPNDTKWTLKYREKKRGLVELIPHTKVYVKGKELIRCIRESNDCRTLARLLLTEVFSHKALIVCSWTGGKAKAFSSVNIDDRPGLDENARMVLLAFVEQHGKKHGWITSNTSAVMSTIRTKMYDIRAKYEQTRIV